MTNLVELSIPTPTNAAAERAQSALAHAQSMNIVTAEQYEAGAMELQAIKGKWREIDEARKQLVKPIDEARKRIQEFFGAPLAFLEKAEGIVKGKLTTFQNEQERIRREEQRKAEEAARKERERLEAQARETERKAREKAAAERRAAEEAAAAGRAEEAARLAERAAATENKAAEKAIELEQRAAAIVAPVIQREAPKVAGLSMRETPKFEIVDASKLPREYLVADESRIRKVVNALKMDANIPGVRVWMDKTPASRAG
ncbi:MAG TPA: hypothetical protein VJA26_18570 [Gammaproteobacteria bacterium]|nr:hypothetical protein [Gammaproteobacteria bacterium]